MGYLGSAADYPVSFRLPQEAAGARFSLAYDGDRAEARHGLGVRGDRRLASRRRKATRGRQVGVQLGLTRLGRCARLKAGRQVAISCSVSQSVRVVTVTSFTDREEAVCAATGEVSAGSAAAARPSEHLVMGCSRELKRGVKVANQGEPL